MAMRSRAGRRSIRLPGYDTSTPGAYFVTICTHDRELLLGDVMNGRMAPSDFGNVVEATWSKIPNHFGNAECDALCLMPNHIHGILVLLTIDGRGTACRATIAQLGHPVPGSLATIIRSFKSASTRRINALRGTPGYPLWQRNYYEHIVRNEDQLQRIRSYIALNPARWSEDTENPARRPRRPRQTKAMNT